MKKVLIGLAVGGISLAVLAAVVVGVLGLWEFLSYKTPSEIAPEPALEIACGPAPAVVGELTLGPPFVYEGTDTSVSEEGTFSAIKAYTVSQDELSPSEVLEEIQKALLSWGYRLEGDPREEISPSPDGLNELSAEFSSGDGRRAKVTIVWKESPFAFEKPIADVGIGFFC